jgi:hypothetical protein
MTVYSLGYQSANAALVELDSASGSNASLQYESFQGLFGVLRVLPSESARDRQPESEAERTESSRSEWDLWLSLDTPSAIREENQLLDGVLDTSEDAENGARLTSHLNLDTVPSYVQFLLSGS